MCHPHEFLHYLRSFNTTVVLSYTPYYPGVEMLHLSNTLPLEEITAALDEAGFQHRLVAQLELAYHRTRPDLHDVPQVLFVLTPAEDAWPLSPHGDVAGISSKGSCLLYTSPSPRDRG